jgi:hypothetical protein
MKPLASKLLQFSALLAIATFGAQYARALWFKAFINDRTFSEPFIWFDSGHAILWCFELLFFFLFGLLVAGLFRSNRPHQWALAFGAICGAFHFLSSRDHFTQEASWSFHLWVYGVYFMPALGALLGAIALQLVSNNSFKRTGLRPAA